MVGTLNNNVRSHVVAVRRRDRIAVGSRDEDIALQREQFFVGDAVASSVFGDVVAVAGVFDQGCDIEAPLCVVGA